MEGFVGGIIVDLVSNIIWEVAGKALNLKWSGGQSDELSAIVGNALKTCDAKLLDSGVFREYIASPQVSDILKNFALYQMKGLASDSLKVVPSKKGARSITERDVVAYLTSNALDRYSDQISAPDKADLEFFFCQVFVASKEYHLSALGSENMSMLLLLTSKMERLTENLKNSLEKNVEVRTRDNWEQARERYHQLLLTNQNKAFVYGISEIKLSDVYVFPEITSVGSISFHDAEWFEDVEEMSLQRQHDWIAESVLFMDDNSWKLIFNDSNIVYVVGGPGYGKSLFLRSLVCNFNEVAVVSAADHLMIPCNLKMFHEYAGGKPYAIVDYLLDSMVAATGLDKDDLPKEMLKHYLNIGRCIILFDALDEVPKEQREDLHNLLIGFFSQNNQNNKVCITSRSRGFLPKEKTTVLSIAPINMKRISAYLDNMIRLGRFDRDNVGRFLSQVWPLVENSFLTNFLILSLLVIIFSAEKQLPDTKVELYRKCFEYIARQREMEKNSLNKIDWNLLRPIMKDNTFIELSKLAAPNNKSLSRADVSKALLAQYASKYVDACKAEQAIHSFLDFCSERTELFVSASEEGSFRFFHRSFFEFYYACYLVRLENPEDIYHHWQQFDVDSEVFELSIAMLKERHETRFKSVLKCLFQKAEDDLRKDKPTFFPLNVLSGIIQIIDDLDYVHEFRKVIHYHSEEIIRYHSMLSSPKAISEEAEKSICSDEEYRAAFREKHEFYSFFMFVSSFRDTEKFLLNNQSRRSATRAIRIPWLMQHPIANTFVREFGVKELFSKYLSLSKSEFINMVNAYSYGALVHVDPSLEFLVVKNMDAPRREKALSVMEAAFRRGTE